MGLTKSPQSHGGLPVPNHLLLVNVSMSDSRISARRSRHVVELYLHNWLSCRLPRLQDMLMGL
jgi:hypothetical protein